MGKIGEKLSKAKKNFSEIDNINQYTSEKATEIIKSLGGHGIKDSRIMADNIICFTNCSGGTGVSTLVSNLAYVLTQPDLGELNVLVIDLSIMTPIQQVFFDEDRDKEESETRSDLVDYLMGQSSIGDATISKGSISLMYAMNRSVADLINCEEDMALDNFTSLVNKASSLYDIVLIDCPMRVENALCNTAMYLADKIYTVWDEGLASIIGTDKLMRQLGFTGVDTYEKMAVVMNKRTDIKYSKYPFERLGIKLIAELPFSTDVISSTLDATVYCRGGKASNRNGRDFETNIIELAEKILVIGGKTAWT